MRVRSELTWRRLLMGLVALTVLPVVLAVMAVTHQSPDLPPGPPNYNPLPLHKDPVLQALQAREFQRSRRVTALAPGLAAPELIPARFPEPVPTLALPPRAQAYDLTELRTAVPAAFGTADDAVLLQANIEVPTGATFLVDSATAPRLRLLSSPGGYAAVIARGGDVVIRGSTQIPVQISSWDPQRAGVDDQPGDGRAFLLEVGGRMDISHADLGYLGYGTGSSSGVAWRGSEHPEGQPGTPATGEVRDSVLHDNWFGAYSFEAANMQWTGNTFRDNAAYGFDPHDSSDSFLVANNVAHGNGRHGFIFSRGCDHNTLRDNLAYDNRGHGFMIDDGRSEDTQDAAARRLASNDNLLVGNRAYRNDGSGIEIEGGTGNVVKGNRLGRNHVGVRVKDDASVLVTGNTVTGSRLAGVDVLAGAGQVRISDNTVTGGWAGIALDTDHAAVLTGNRIDKPSAPLVIAGQPQRDTGVMSFTARILRWNPMLVLWIAILWLPTALALRHLLRMARRPSRGQPAHGT